MKLFLFVVIEFIENDILARVKCPILVASCKQTEDCYPKGKNF